MGEFIGKAPISNLLKVQEALWANPRIFVAGDFDLYVPDNLRYRAKPLIKRKDIKDIIGKEKTDDNTYVFAELAEFFVAPINGAFDVKSLEKFSLNLAKLLPFTSIDQKVEERFGGIAYGALMCDDVLAKRFTAAVSIVEEIEPKTIKNMGLQRGKSETSSYDTLMRRTLIWVVPHPILASILRNKLATVNNGDTQLAQSLSKGITEGQLALLEELASDEYIDFDEALRQLFNAAKKVECEGDMDILKKRWPLGEH
jgi:hypothetical protein